MDYTLYLGEVVYPEPPYPSTVIIDTLTTSHTHAVAIVGEDIMFSEDPTDPRPEPIKNHRKVTV